MLTGVEDTDAHVPYSPSMKIPEGMLIRINKYPKVT